MTVLMNIESAHGGRSSDKGIYVGWGGHSGVKESIQVISVWNEVFRMRYQVYIFRMRYI